MSEPAKPPILDYRPSARGSKAGGWLRRINSGEDSFLACSALLFAVLTWVMAIAGLALNVGVVGCGGVLPVILSLPLALFALLERRTSKTFPLVALALDCAYLSLLVIAALIR